MNVTRPSFNQLQAYIEEKKEEFQVFYNLLIEYNKRYNLTAILEEKEVYYKHFLDSLAGVHLFNKQASVAEVGSGAGFPSIPLMIVREDLCFTLIESTGKKCDFLKIVIDQLKLNATVLSKRAEIAAKNNNYREKYDFCCARAVARLNTLCEYCLPFVKVGGYMVAYKGNAEEEIKECKKAISILGGEEEKFISYQLPENYGERTLIRIKKIKNTPEKYPRGQGKERSKPL